MKMEQTECSETSAYNSRRRVITQKKAYNIQNTAKAWNQVSRVVILIVYLHLILTISIIILIISKIISDHIINEISLDDRAIVNNTLYSSPSDTRRDLMMAQCKARNMLS